MREIPAFPTARPSPLHTLNTVMTWAGKLAAMAGGGLAAVVAPSAKHPPLANCAEMPIADWLAWRLNRAAFLEAAIADAIETLQPVEARGASLTAASVVRNLQRILEGPKPPAPGAVVH